MIKPDFSGGTSMERLTLYAGNGDNYESINPIDTPYEYGKLNLQKIINKLALYEDAEEQGLLHVAPIANGTTIYVWQTDEDDCYFIHNEAYVYGYTEYMYGKFGKDFFTSEEDCRNLYEW